MGVTFSVYLIHMHPLMIDILFKKIFVIEPYIDSLKTGIIYHRCNILDFFRLRYGGPDT